MGTGKYEVLQWVRLREHDDSSFHDKIVYQGNWLGAAIWAMMKAKMDSGCVSLIWRG